MKRYAAFAALLVLACAGLSAAVWDGSAVTGVATDFPGEGLYGECNSFPRDTTVTLTNLENGKSVTITITNGIENPGIFIALSPKAASQLDMKPGSAARVRAVAMTASQAEASLPPARAGETSDPDYNPKIYVARAKEAERSGAASTPETAPAVAAAPTAVTQVENPPPTAAQAEPPANPPASAQVSASTAPQNAQAVVSEPSGNYQFQGSGKTSIASANLPNPEPPSSAAPAAAASPSPAVVAVTSAPTRTRRLPSRRRASRKSRKS